MQPYYEYQGDAGYDARFVLDETFINAVKANNVKMNGYLIQFDQSEINLGDGKDIEKFEVYDQTVYINKGETRPYLVEFNTKNDLLTKDAVEEAYKGYITDETKNSLTVSLGTSQFIFEFKDGIITKVKL